MVISSLVLNMVQIADDAAGTDINVWLQLVCVPDHFLTYYS